MKYMFTFLLSILCITLTANPYAVSTFECSGIYWKTPKAEACKIQYRETGSTAWRNGLDLIWDERDGEYRGSIIGLKPATGYEVKLSAGSAQSQLKFRTRSDNFTVGKTTILPGGETDKPVTISESGTEKAYHLVTVPKGSKSVLNLKNVYEDGIIIDADYVIVRGVEIRNAGRDGIRIRKGRHDIIIEQCHMTFWGGIGGPRTYGNEGGGSAIYAEEGTSNLTLQRNLMEDPRGAANDWETGHPVGPQGISIWQSKGGNVIRYNDVVSTEDHGFNDAIGGGQNRSNEGNVNRDSDVYGNLIRSVWDDCIECEGANMNVRIWGNYMHKYFVGIATASVSKGPAYIFRNVMGESRRGHSNPTGGTMFKTGNSGGFGGGLRLIFHNTAVQPGGPSTVIGRDPQCITRNNIFNVTGELGPENEIEPPFADYDYDFYPSRVKEGREVHGYTTRLSPAGGRLLVNSYRLEFYPLAYISTVTIGRFPFQFGEREVNITDPVFQIKSPLIDTGVLLPGFNDDFKGAGPDLGAFERGNPPLEFGRRAYLKYDEGWAPWEE